jgi:N-acylneuraminate cytidylyltransferase
MNVKTVAFIPARSGSGRVPNKNVANFGGHPLIARSILAAINSAVFDDVICVTDSEQYAEVARHYGASVPALRPLSTAGAHSADIEWLAWILDYSLDMGLEWDLFAILRPTSPFRRSTLIRESFDCFMNNQPADSLRAMSKVREHPGKMWIMRGDTAFPLMPFSLGGNPWHSSPYQSLPEVYVQNACLEFAWTRVVRDTRTISGNHVIGFVCDFPDDLDVNQPVDLELAANLLGRDGSLAEQIEVEPYGVLL